MEDNKKIQEEYYAKTASKYDNMHISESHDGEHDFAMSFLSAVIKKFNIRSILDVGAGTGRTIRYLQANHPDLSITGIEPVKELREQGHKNGVSDKILIDGDGNKMNFEDGAFDLVCVFGVLHHVPRPAVVVDEMLRVAKKAIFISDANNFGQGSYIARSFKQVVNFFGLWRAFDFVRTKGKMYLISEGDGLFYPYSVFNNYKQVKRKCSNIHLLNTKGSSINFYRGTSHLALLGLKK